MRLLVTSNRYVPVYSGAARQEHAVFARLVAAGHDVRVTTLRWPGLDAHATLDGVAIRRAGSPGRLGRLRFAARCARDAARDRAPRLLAMSGGWGPWLALRAASRRGARVVLRLSLDGSDDPVSVSRQRFGARKLRLMRTADAVICLTPALVDRCRRAGFPESTLHLVPNGVDLDGFPATDAEARARARVRLGIEPDARVAIFAGELNRRKAIVELVEAWRARSDARAHDVLLLCGPADPEEAPGFDTSYLGRVRRSTAASAGRGEVRITGRLGRDALREHLAASDVYVSRSRAEGLPNALLEAMASGLPVVTSAAPGALDHVLDDGVHGRLVADGDDAGFRDALEAILASPDGLREAGRRARARVEERFSLERKVRAYREVLRLDARDG